MPLGGSSSFWPSAARPGNCGGLAGSSPAALSIDVRERDRSPRRVGWRTNGRCTCSTSDRRVDILRDVLANFFRPSCKYDSSGARALMAASSVMTSLPIMDTSGAAPVEMAVVNFCACSDQGTITMSTFTSGFLASNPAMHSRQIFSEGVSVLNCQNVTVVGAALLAASLRGALIKAGATAAVAAVPAARERNCRRFIAGISPLALY